MILTLIFLLTSIFFLIKSADLAIHYSTKLAESLKLSKLTVGFLIVAVISVLPEGFISIISALENVPSFGLGTLFGSNVADLTLVFALVIFVSGRNLKIESKLIKGRLLHLLTIMTPIIFGLNGYYSRWEGVVLIIIGLSFYFYVLRKNEYDTNVVREKFKFKNFIFLILSMAALLVSSHFIVKYGISLAHSLKVSPVLIGMFIVGLGTTLPELFFSIKAAKNYHDSLALGDVLGTVIADATIIVGLIAVINPFAFAQKIVYITGIFMVLAMILLFYFMKSDKILTKKEAFYLLLFYTFFVMVEFFSSGS